MNQPAYSSRRFPRSRPGSPGPRRRSVPDLESLEARTLLSQQPIVITAGQTVRSSKPVAPAVTLLTVPGQPGTMVTVTFTLDARLARFKNEMGLFPVDDATGRIGNLRPGSRGYLRAALLEPGRTVIFHNTQPAGTVTTLTLPAGARYGLYLVANGTTARALAAGNRHAPFVYFSIQPANPDRFNHLRGTSGNHYTWEDGYAGGDRDFNDLMWHVTFTGGGQGGAGGGGQGNPPVVTLDQPLVGTFVNHNVTVSGRVTDPEGDAGETFPTKLNTRPHSSDVVNG
jgi:Domain of unknown function (DUF4114)